MELKLGRSVLVNRVADIPAPPAFVFRAFVSSTPLAASRCERVDQRSASRRIWRSRMVDRAPCVPVAGESEVASAMVDRAQCVPVAGAPEVAPAVPRPDKLVRVAVRREPSRPQPARREPSRRTLRSRSVLPGAAISRAMFPKATESGTGIVEALSELDAAFG